MAEILCLERIGFDERFRELTETLNRPDLVPARVSAVNRDNYRILHETGEIQAEATGGLLYGAESRLDYPVTGDWVMVQLVDEGAFAVIHEVPDPAPVFARLADLLAPGGRLLLTEPTGHVTGKAFEQEIARAEAAGLTLVERPAIRRSLSALLRKPAAN